MLDKARQPVIVGVGRHTQRPPKDIRDSFTPIGMASHCAYKAAIDTGLSNPEELLREVVAIGTVSMGGFFERRWSRLFKTKPFTNFSRSIANRIGAEPKECVISFPGGNGPQFMVNLFAGMIAEGRIEQGPIIIGGCEMNSTFDRAVREDKIEVLKECGWDDTSVHESATIVNDPKNTSGEILNILMQELSHGCKKAINTYALFENAYHKSQGNDKDEQRRAIAKLFSRFSIVAASQPEHSWFPMEKTMKAMVEESRENRMIAYPYSKNIVARDEVDQSAFVMIMSLEEAERRKIDSSKIVYLWGSGDAYDSNVLSLRYDLSRCPSMHAAYNEAFTAAGLNLEAGDAEKVAVFDLYSCFPIAVEMACHYLGFDPEKTSISKLTATGGLPYHGGPGSNYSTHGLCAIIEKLRTDYYRDEFGMVAANGGYLTEHSVGIYSTKPPSKNYKRRDLEMYAPDCQMPVERFTFTPKGKARILAWSCEYKREPNMPKQGYIIGEMEDGDDIGKRFCATTKVDDQATISWLLEANRVGEVVHVDSENEKKQIGSIAAYPVSFSKVPSSAL